MIRSMKFFAALALLGSIIAMSGNTAAQDQTQQSLPSLKPDDRSLGKTDAPVVVFEYASMGCPHCGAFMNEKMGQVKTDWIDSGKVRWVFRDFPLDGLSLRAAALGRCLPPDKFFGFVDAVFHDQQKWVHMADADAFHYVGSLGGMTSDQADACIKNQQVVDYVTEERFTGEKTYGINMTPYFFVNGQRIAGNPDYPQLTQVLKDAMPKP